MFDYQPPVKIDVSNAKRDPRLKRDKVWHMCAESRQECARADRVEPMVRAYQLAMLISGKEPPHSSSLRTSVNHRNIRYGYVKIPDHKRGWETRIRAVCLDPPQPTRDWCKKRRRFVEVAPDDDDFVWIEIPHWDHIPECVEC